ncbi:hypothetical protein GC207_10375 [bacterium]|nr:hypothetical protein [bacterium]
MISYIPFLKAKQGELTAIGALAPNVKMRICPFFDFPRKKNYDAALFAETTGRIARGLNRHWDAEREFYFDDLDVKEKLTVEGRSQYAYVLVALRRLSVIPVVGLDRLTHNASVADLKRNGKIASSVVAFRAQPQDFEDFDERQEEIESDLEEVFQEFEQIDLILDCQLCTGLDVATTARQIAAFAQKFSAAYKKVRRVIVAGSSIPASSRDVLATNSDCSVPRRELAIISKARALCNVDLVTGDYAVISPFYSDADLDPRIMQKVMTARLAYSYKSSHYFIRGSSVGVDGYEQYFDLAETLCGQSFFRGSNYSLGDEYFYDKSRRSGSNCTPSAVIKPSVVAHITYMVIDAKV